MPQARSCRGERITRRTTREGLARDNRWGRYDETWAEEPALSGAIGAANITGMQSGTCSSGSRLKVASTVKHFAGYSESLNGHDRVEAQLPIRYPQDQFLPSYADGINAGADTVMVDSGSINGVPATASHFLLTTELRQRLGFKGVVISDYGDVLALQGPYHIAPDLATAAARVITGPNADSVLDTLGGWSVSWQGVFDNNIQACCAAHLDHDLAAWRERQYAVLIAQQRHRSRTTPRGGTPPCSLTSTTAAFRCGGSIRRFRGSSR